MKTSNWWGSRIFDVVTSALGGHRFKGSSKSDIDRNYKYLLGTLPLLNIPASEFLFWNCILK